ncbi:NAD(P)-dependent alcohol dehydrogenase [Nonomuraea sp. NPDC059023]|uniref:NAD(P)-dependent alcohol dehydrogenase n=1 Tax=unclassified Nonomuraea TaxID=2593643 RepID=UPI0036878A8B
MATLRRTKAWVWERYGSPDVLALREVDEPEPGRHEVLVRVRAAAVNPYDWRHLRSDPHLVRLSAGLRRPKPGSILGADLAGVVERVGADVRGLAVGDEVFGGVRLGAFAEAVAVPQETLVPKPEDVSFEAAAAVPMAGQTALKALDGLVAGQRVLVNGASGGIGTFTVQLAKALGAHVTGVCGAHNADLVRSLGADEVVDYNREDFTRPIERYDLLVDLVGNRSLKEFRRALTPKGTLALVGGLSSGGGRVLGPLVQVVKGMVVARFVGQRITGVSWKPGKQALNHLAELLAAKEIVPVVDRVYPLAEVPEAIRYVESMRARGKVVITIGQGETR